MKKKLILIMMTLFVSLSTIGCGSNNDIENEIVVTSDGYVISPFDFTNKEMVYDVNTNIVYVKNYTSSNSCIYIPYLSSNGHPYKCVDGKLVELKEF